MNCRGQELRVREFAPDNLLMKSYVSTLTERGSPQSIFLPIISLVD